VCSSDLLGFGPYTIDLCRESPADSQTALGVKALKLDRDAAGR
jgi:hypothetical protein